MKRLSGQILLFSILFAVFIMGPAVLGSPFGPYPLMKMGDFVDLFTPLVLIPLYWVLFRLSPEEPPGSRETLLFLVLAAFWVIGQGMHLAANSIGHLLEHLKGTDIHTLTTFYDEVLSHYLWHFGMVGLSALLLYRQWRHPFAGEPAGQGLVTAAGVIHGFTYFTMIVEARTVPMGVPFAVVVAILTLIWGRKKLRQRPLLAFFTVAFVVATVFFAGWAIYWGGLPEFSAVGII